MSRRGVVGDGFRSERRKRKKGCKEEREKGSKKVDVRRVRGVGGSTARTPRMRDHTRNSKSETNLLLKEKEQSEDSRCSRVRIERKDGPIET